MLIRYISFFVIFSLSLLFSSDFSKNLSSQGFTGLINTPNAQVLNSGDTVFHFNNQFNNHLRAYDYNKAELTEESYIYGLGFLPSFEVVGRLTEAKEDGVLIGIRDLSFNAKYNILNEVNYLPSLAIGVQDLGGAANYFENYYIVSDKKIGFLRASLGYGVSKVSSMRTKRMDGLFGGVEGKVNDSLTFMAEHDGKESHMGVRLVMPKHWLSSVDIDAMLIQNMTEPQTSFAINLLFPLQSDYSRSQINSIVEERYHKKNKKTVEYPFNGSIKTPKLIEERKTSNLLTLQKELVKIGFENVQVGYYEKSIYIKLENTIFDQTELDAMGVVMGKVMNFRGEYEHCIITLLKNNLQIMTFSSSIQAIKNFFEKSTIENEKKLRESLKFTKTFDEKRVVFVSKSQNSSFFVPRLELSPGLTTTVGTEVGLFDYLVGLRGNVYTTLYDGLTLSTIYETPLFHSQNFNEGFTFATQYSDRLKSRFVDTLLSQTLHYESLFNTTSVGQFQSNYYGVLNHSNFTTISGEHGLNLRIGKFRNRINNSEEERNIYLASYRYFYAPLDLSAEVTYGQYWNQDRGGSLELKRFFGNTSVSLYIKDSVKTFAGFKVSIPLTFRKLAKSSRFGQIKGKKDFSYDIRTVVRSPDSANALTPGGAIIPKSSLELVTHYLDRDRLNSSYIKKHLSDIREAYIEYENL